MKYNTIHLLLGAGAVLASAAPIATAVGEFNPTAVSIAIREPNPAANAVAQHGSLHDFTDPDITTVARDKREANPVPGKANKPVYQGKRQENDGPRSPQVAQGKRDETDGPRSPQVAQG